MNDQVEKINTVCMWCHAHCYITASVKDGVFQGFEENKSHPFSKLLTPLVRGCPRARAAAEWFYHPDRLNYPLKRVGERGEGKWQTIPWDQALGEIAEKLNKIKMQYGPEAIATSSGTGRTHDEFRIRFFNLLGSPNHVGQGHICHGPFNLLSCAMFGWYLYPFINPKTKCVMIWGGGAWEHPLIWRATLEALRRGTKLIVADPRGVASSMRADVWLQLRPGTDGALLMAMLNVIINENLYDKEFVAKWCFGFDKLAERVQAYTPEKVSEITWVPAQQIREAARLYASSKPAASIRGMGLEHLPNCIEALQARFAIVAICGNIDISGGDLIQGPYTRQITGWEIEANERLAPEQRLKQIGSDRFRFMATPGYYAIEENVVKGWGKMASGKMHFCFAHAPSVYRAMVTGKPYPVKAMLTAASNPMVTQGNTKLIYKALKNLDLYTVLDFWMTPSAELADYVLPAASWLERPVIWDGFGLAKFLFAGKATMPAIVEGKYERYSDFDFWRGLGLRMGQEKDWPWKTLDEAYDYRLSPMGLSFKEFIAQKGGWDSPPTEFEKYKRMGFATPTGKIELYSTILEKLGYDPLPQYQEPPEGPVAAPELAKEYPYILITGGRFNPFYHSEHRQIESLRNKRPYPFMQLNPETAVKLGINEGDWVWIETPRGRVRQKCEYFKGIDPKVVHAEHGWWFPEEPSEEPWLHGVWESNINVVTDDEPDHCNPISGGWPLRTGLCRVYKAKTY